MTELLYDEIVYAQNAFVQAREDLFDARLALTQVGLCMLLICGVGTFEVTVAFTLMDATYGPELPGQPTPFNVLLMSAATLVGVIGYEVLKAYRPDHKALKLIEQVAYILLPIFFGGMVAMFAVSDIASGPVDTNTPVNDDVLFGAPQQDDAFFSDMLGMFSAFALGSLVILNLVVISKLVEVIWAKLPGAMAKWNSSRSVIKTSKSVVTQAQGLVVLTHEIGRLDKQFTDDLNAVAAGNIEAAAAPTLRTLRKLEARAVGKPDTPRTLLSRRNPRLPHPLPDETMVSAFVKALQTKLSKLPDQFRSFLD